MSQKRSLIHFGGYIILALALLLIVSSSANAVLAFDSDPEDENRQALLQGRILPVDRAFAAQALPPEPQYPDLVTVPVALSGSITFASDRMGGFDLYAQAADENSLFPIVSGAGADVTPRWSPDGRELVFASDRDGDYEIYRRTEAGLQVQLTHNAADDAHPTWSPAGDAIYFASNRADDNYRIYRMDRNGGHVQEVLAIPGQNVLAPSISPEGNRLAYMQASFLTITCFWNWDIWIMNLDGSGRRQLTTNLAGDFFPQWSPDGREIVYGGCKNLVDADLVAVNPDTRVERRLNSWFLSDEWGAAFSPDGGHLAFNSNRDGNQDIFILDLAQSLASNFTRHAAVDMHPSWTGPTMTPSPTPTSTPSPTPTITPTPGGSDLFFTVIGEVVNGVPDAQSRPVDNVSVSTDTGFRTTTDSDGQFTLSGLPSGLHRFYFAKEGWRFPHAPVALNVTRDTALPQILAYKPPIVFVHGFQGINFDIGCGRYNPVKTFGAIAQLLRQEGGYLIDYASLETSPCHTPSLQANVPNVIRAIERVKVFTGHDRVILIGHSMGGLVSRLYVEGSYYEDDVQRLFTFGSPHWGIPEELLLYWLGPNAVAARDVYCLVQEAVCDFSLTGMLAFNLLHPLRRSGVSYYAVSGAAPPQARNVRGTITGFFLLGDDDGLVHTYSGADLPGVVYRYRPPEVHSSYWGPHSYFWWEDDGNPQSYTACLKRVLIDAETDGCGSEITLSANNAPSDPGVNMAPIIYGTLQPGGGATHTYVSEGGATLFVSQWLTGTLEMHLVDPNGSIVDPAYAQNHPTEVDFSAELGWAGYEIAQAQAGEWRVVLQASDVPAAGSAYAIFSTSESDLAFDAETDKLWLGAGEAITVTANLDPAPLAGAITGTVLYAGGGTEGFQLVEAGGGSYSATLIAPNAPGYAEIRLVASGQTATGSLFKRGRVLSFQISPQTIALTGLYSDQPAPRWPDASVYDAIEVSAQVTVTAAGTYGFAADLVDSAGQFVAHSAATAELPAGTGEFVLRFDGREVYASGLSGPYTLTQLILTDQRGPSLVVGTWDDVYETAPYRYTDFRPADFFLPLMLKGA